MSLVSSRVSLLHRTTVERDANAGTSDGWGQAQPADWQAHLSDLPCRVWTRAGREQIDAATSIVAEDMRLVVELGTDVTEQDRLGDVTYRGDTIVAGPISIRAVVARKDHVELFLERIA